MRVSLIIATKDRPTQLVAALASSAEALPRGAELIVVDGDRAQSAEPLVADLRTQYPDLNAVYLPSDPGLCLQRNVGIDAASGEVLVFVDDDCTFEPSLFEALLDVYRDPTVIGATGRVEEPQRERLGSSEHSRGFRRPIVDVEHARDVEYMPGALMSARREVAAEVRFDEQLSNYSLGEDDDFSYRVSRRGRIRYEPAAVVHPTQARGSQDRSAQAGPSPRRQPRIPVSQELPPDAQGPGGFRCAACDSLPASRTQP